MQATQKSTRQDFQIKCQCSIIKQGIKLNLKKKSKFSTVILTSDNFLTIIPFGIAQQPENTIRFDLKKLKNIHKRYLDEGKVTLQFLQRMEREVIRGNFVLASDEKVEVLSRVFIDNASKENLQLLIQKILQFKKLKNPIKNDKMEPQKKQIHNKKVKINNQTAQRSESPPLDRKKLRQMALKDSYPKKKLKQQPKFEQKKITFNLLKLPPDILENIFSYCQINLSMRVISRQFSDYILRNIKYIRFNDFVPEDVFNKLAKWAINIQCRMKNVHNIDLQNKNQQLILMKNVAKTLKFGKWKQIKAKNIAQIKGLKIYCLEIPYIIKFNFNFLMGVRLVELRLKGKSSTRNSYVNDQIIQYANTIKTLKVIQIPYADSNLLLQLQNKQRFTQIKIGTLDLNNQDFSWSDLNKFPNLEVFGIQQVTKQGTIKNWNIHFFFPEKLLNLEIGSYIADQSLEILPQSINRLKLIGDKYYNNVVLKINIPNLKFLDISECRYLGSDCLSNLLQATILTNWQKQTTLAAQDRFTLRNLRVIPRK